MKTLPRETLFVHETNSDGLHRIIAVLHDGTVTPGEWTESRQLATLFDLYANSDLGNGLPPGVFRVREVPHQVLT